MERQYKLVYALALILTLGVTSCLDKPDIPLTEGDSKDAYKKSTLRLKFLRDTSWVDSLVYVRYLRSSDTLLYISPFTDTIMEQMQTKIFELEKVKMRINATKSQRWAWFTQLVDHSDSTKDFSLYIVLRKGEAIENGCFRFNEANQLVGVNNNPIVNNVFVDIDKWKADTIAFDE